MKFAFLLLVAFATFIPKSTAFKPLMPRQMITTRLQQHSPLDKQMSSFKSTPLIRSEMTLQMSEAAAPAPTSAGSKSGLWNIYLKTMDTLTILFPLWTVLFAGLAIVRPQSFSWFTTQYFTFFLGNTFVLTVNKLNAYPYPLHRCIDAFHGYYIDP